MSGDVSDPSVTTAWVRSGTIFGCTREEGRGLMREVRLALAVGSGLCRRFGLRGEGRYAARHGFSETENVRRSAGYNGVISLTVGL